MSAHTLVQQRHGLVLEDIDWKTYSRLLRIFEERPGIRLTYDRGALEILPLLEHDIDGRFLGRLVVTLTEELGFPVLSGGSTTLRRQLHQRGIESDECFWIANEPRMRGRRALNLQRDPPPDLAVEVDVTSSSLDRLDIYATLRVPEIWRLHGDELGFLSLQPDLTYAETSHSLSFPQVTSAGLAPFLEQRLRADENTVIRSFREWIRKHLLPPKPKRRRKLS
jgi:Uma2 family endonuclease